MGIGVGSGRVFSKFKDTFKPIYFPLFVDWIFWMPSDSGDRGVTASGKAISVGKCLGLCTNRGRFAKSVEICRRICYVRMIT